MSEVSAVFTPCSETDLLALLHEGHVKAFDEDPSPERLGFAWAQMALEMGRGKKIRCGNFGNITVSKSWTGDFFTLHVPPPDPPVLRFRAYPSLLTGATGYWSFMDQRFHDELALFDSGNAYLTAQKLGEVHYYLADRETYSRAVEALYAEYQKRLKGVSTEPSAEELSLAGTLWRLHDDLDEGLQGIDAIDAVVKGS